MKRRSHLVVMRVTFDRPCGAAYARREAWDSIHGEFYTNDLHPRPESFKAKVLKNRSVPIRIRMRRRPLKGQMKLPLERKP